ncbi:hypothetical protein ACJX0J_032426, partial [Zea mays]
KLPILKLFSVNLPTSEALTINGKIDKEGRPWGSKQDHAKRVAIDLHLLTHFHKHRVQAL